MGIEFKCLTNDFSKHDLELNKLFYGMVGSYEYDVNHGEIDYEYLDKQFEQALNRLIELGYIKKVIE